MLKTFFAALSLTYLSVHSNLIIST